PLEILGDNTKALREGFDPLTPRRAAADGAVGEVANRAVGKVETGDEIVLADGFYAVRGQGKRRYAHRFRLQQPVHQVDEIAGLAEDCATDRGIGHPVATGDTRRLDAAVKHRR